MAEYATKRDVQSIVNKAVDDLSDVIAQFSERVDERFARLETRMDSLEERVARLEDSQTRLADTLDHFLKRLDDTEKDNVARDAQVARLERWVETIAKQTGVKLEY